MIQKETGWTDEYLLWGLSWANVQMKLADAPYYKYKPGKPGKSGKSGKYGYDEVIDEDELVGFLNEINGP